MTSLIGRSRHVTGWTTLRLVVGRIQDLDRKFLKSRLFGLTFPSVLAVLTYPHFSMPGVRWNFQHNGLTLELVSAPSAPPPRMLKFDELRVEFSTTTKYGIIMTLMALSHWAWLSYVHHRTTPMPPFSKHKTFV